MIIINKFFSINKKRIRHIQVLFAMLILFLATPGLAQIYEPDGLRMPGTWNNWTNEQGMGGAFDLQKIQTGAPRWTTTFEFSDNTAFQEFKFASTSFGNVWGNQWAGIQDVQVNTLTTFIYGTPSDPDNGITLSPGKWYTVVFEDSGYENTRAIFMETSGDPVNITDVIQNPVLAGDMEPVAVSASLTGPPSPEENFFLVYTIDGWEQWHVVPMTVSGNQLSVELPGQASGTGVEYYLFSSVMEAPAEAIDLISIRTNDNNGSLYGFTVDQEIDCETQSGLISSVPAFPMEDEPVTIYFNAAFGNGGLFNFEGDVYAHTGVITNLSTGLTDWRYVMTAWGENTPETKMLRLEDNLYSLSMDSPREFYGVPASEQIERLAFVFRSDEEHPDGYYLEHKNADGSDIFVGIYELSLNVKITSPDRRAPLASPNTLIPICVEALENEVLKLYLNDELLVSENTGSLSYPLVLQGLESGSHWIVAVAESGGEEARDSVNIFLRPPVEVVALPEGMRNGINYVDDNTVTLVLHDPPGQKQFVFAIGEYSNWLPTEDNYMKRTPDGTRYWVTITGLEAGQEYAFQYLIDGNLKLADPYAEKILDPWNDPWIPATTYPDLKPYPFDKTTGIVSVMHPGRQPYTWQIPDFTPPALNETQSDLLIYELLIRDFVETRNIADVQEKLGYLKDLGVNAVQLMPIIEFDGNESWGYAPNFFFATDKYYGTRQAYKEFIDAAHAMDMAVILDIVPNHAFGQSPMVLMYFDPDAGDHGQPLPQNPWFNMQAPHPYSVGYDFNHESPYTREFFKEVFSYWLTEFKVDGFRIDLSKGLTQTYSGDDMGAWSTYDQSRIDILTDYYHHIKAVSPNAYVILEHFAANDEETVLANTGMLLWSAMHERYQQVAMGWEQQSDLSWAYHGSRGWSYPNLIDYMENHDEERLMYNALTYGNASNAYNLNDTATALRHMEQAHVLFLGIPGPKMLWQFQELGYDYSIFYGGDRLAPKPVRWDYADSEERERIHRIIGGMARLRKSDAFRFGSFSHDLGGLGKRMWITHADMDVVIAANMGVDGFDMQPGFTNTGTWHDYFSGESFEVTNPASHTLHFGPGDYRVFTSVPLPKPFHQLTIVTISDATDELIEGVTLSMTNAGRRITNHLGTASYLALPQTVTITAEKEGWISQSVDVEVENDMELTIRMKSDDDETGLEETAGTIPVVIYPNPANRIITIENGRGKLLQIYGVDGRLYVQKHIVHNEQQVNVQKLRKGVYVVRILGDHIQESRRLIIH
ncbi:MAG: alpha-amylase family glycosyl hydrolase [Bacteroidales bacterium]|nr:alpha-amylase family glycosyl hydrolase [Bacteroidales bacterium]